MAAHNRLCSFREMLAPYYFSAPILDRWAVKLESDPGFIQLQGTGGSFAEATLLHDYDWALTPEQIMTITDALLADRLRSTPAPETSTRPHPIPFVPTALAPSR